MLVTVTGGTGFVGSHTARLLLEKGHRVRLLVRDMDKAERVYASLGCPMPEMVIGDMTDNTAVARAVDGCDAVVHSAAMVTMDPSRRNRMLWENFRGTDTVLKQACYNDVRSVVYVSSIAALFDRGSGIIRPNPPLAESRKPYARSKIESERIARFLMREGYPVSITYPATVIGPEDPGLSEGNYAIKTYLKRSVPRTSGGFQFIDVRDLAKIHVALIEGKLKNGLFLAGGHYRSWDDLADLVQEATGKPVGRIPLPPALLRFTGKLFDMTTAIHGSALPFSYEAMCYATRWRPTDDSETLEKLGIKLRSPIDTLRDTAAWLCRAGHINQDLPAARFN